jgi:hypothetical protein
VVVGEFAGIVERELAEDLAHCLLYPLAGRHDGAAYIAMQFIAGQNAERFAERDP